MKIINLSQGKQTFVDNEDFEYLSKFKWHYGSNGYAVRSEFSNGKYNKILMHRIINNTPIGFETDHIDKNKLNNCRINLRTCSNSMNQANKGLQKNNKSGYRGVCFDNTNNCWVAYITTNHRHKFLGFFENKIDAAKVYDKKAKEIYGDFAFINFPNICCEVNHD